MKVNFSSALRVTLTTLTALTLSACSAGDDEDDGGLPAIFTKQVVVFGIPVLASDGVEDAALLHTAAILAEYLDSDEDGTANAATVAAYMAQNDSIMAVLANEDELNSVDFGNMPSRGNSVVTVKANEIVLEGSGMDNEFDPTIEEVLHLVTSTGYARVFPNELGESVGSTLADAMDAARGGRFTSIPDSYPEDAWYTYSDESCDYKCQVTEYTYWGVTSYLGAQSYDGRLEEIESEWRLNTAAKIEETDEALYTILNDEGLMLPNRLPDGAYEGASLAVESR